MESESTFELIAKTFQGLEEVLAQELTVLGAQDIKIGRRMVSFTGDKEMMYRANFYLRTAIRILKPIKHFKAEDADEVYNAVKSIEWDRYIDLKTTFSVDSVIYSQEFRHSKFVAYKVKDAIVDYFREKTGERPNIRVTNPDLKLNIHIAEDDCTLSFDSSGESLHRRGYRVASVEAPINEVLAAGLIMLSGWKGDCDLIDPMCGSGTIPIEAALIARNIAPGIFRNEFAFERWKDFDRDLLDTIYNDDSQERPFDHKIYGYDINAAAIASAEANVKSAHVGDIVTLQQKDFQKFTQPQEQSLIIMNPPYGERIASPNLLGLYRTIGERLKHQFVGGEAWIISYREECFDQIGLKPSFKIPLFNGSLDCEFRKYQIFDGKLKEFRETGDIKTDEERSRMAEKKRFKQHRDFKKSFNDDDDSSQESEIPDYILRKHRDFVARQRRNERRNERQRYDDSTGTERNDRHNGHRYNERSTNSERKGYHNDRKSYGGNGDERHVFGRDHKPFNRKFNKKRHDYEE